MQQLMHSHKEFANSIHTDARASIALLYNSLAQARDNCHAWMRTHALNDSLLQALLCVPRTVDLRALKESAKAAMLDELAVAADAPSQSTPKKIAGKVRKVFFAVHDAVNALSPIKKKTHALKANQPPGARMLADSPLAASSASPRVAAGGDRELSSLHFSVRARLSHSRTCTRTQTHTSTFTRKRTHVLSACINELTTCIFIL